MRDIVTDVVTDVERARPDEQEGPRGDQEGVLKRLKAQTDVKAQEVLLTDVAIQ